MNGMMSLFFRVCVTMALLAQLTAAHAEAMYQCVDDLGHKTLSNVKLSDKSFKCVVLDLGPIMTVPKPPSQPDFPKVDDTTQKEFDNDRQRILEDELAAERQNLEQAKKELAEQERAEQESVRDDGERKNCQEVPDCLKSYKDKVAQHERNIEALENELDRFRHVPPPAGPEGRQEPVREQWLRRAASSPTLSTNGSTPASN
jgi:hypothetical protein